MWTRNMLLPCDENKICVLFLRSLRQFNVGQCISLDRQWKHPDCKNCDAAQLWGKSLHLAELMIDGSWPGFVNGSGIPVSPTKQQQYFRKFATKALAEKGKVWRPKKSDVASFCCAELWLCVEFNVKNYRKQASMKVLQHASVGSKLFTILFEVWSWDQCMNMWEVCRFMWIIYYNDNTIFI